MAISYSPNSLLAIKPNRFYRARIRNVRWNRDMTIDTTVAPVNVNEQVVPNLYSVVPPPIISNQNENISRIKDRYNS